MRECKYEPKPGENLSFSVSFAKGRAADIGGVCSFKFNGIEIMVCSHSCSDNAHAAYYMVKDDSFLNFACHKCAKASRDGCVDTEEGDGGSGPDDVASKRLTNFMYLLVDAELGDDEQDQGEA